MFVRIVVLVNRHARIVCVTIIVSHEQTSRNGQKRTRTVNKTQVKHSNIIHP